jgi:hypothetical protein
VFGPEAVAATAPIASKIAMKEFSIIVAID